MSLSVLILVQGHCMLTANTAIHGFFAEGENDFIYWWVKTPTNKNAPKTKLNARPSTPTPPQRHQQPAPKQVSNYTPNHYFFYFL
jgi:hypothetical protein